MQALASARSLPEIITGAQSWVAEALGLGGSMRLYKTNAAGRLHCVTGDRGNSSRGPRASARRRAVMRSARAASTELESAGLAVESFPLISRGEGLGVLEVEGSRGAIGENRGVLQAVADAVAIALGHLRERSSLQRDVDRLTRAVALGNGLVAAGSPQEAILAAVRFLHEHLGGTVAGWFPAPEGDLRLSAIRGVGEPRARELRRDLSTLAARNRLGDHEREDLARRFAGLVGTDHADAVPVGDAVLLLAPANSENAGPLQVVASLLGEVLQRLMVVADAEARNEQLDFGLAWIAHEVRSPLLGVKAAIEYLLRGDQPPQNRQMLRRSLVEVERLSDLVEGVLRWAVGAAELQPVQLDLVAIVRQAVDTCTLQPGDDRVVVTAPSKLPMRADPTHLRTAITNVVRNALLYSPSGSDVSVTVDSEGDLATIRVSDSGPGILDAERESIFDPMVRGASAVRGFGLGLFIAKRVVEEHMGTIRAEQDPNGAIFIISVPIEGATGWTGRRVARSASLRQPRHARARCSE